MNIRHLYREGIWHDIETHPNYSLGVREKEGLKRFLAEGNLFGKHIASVIHLAVATGQEVPLILEALPAVKNYLLNDICEPVLQQTTERATKAYSHVRFPSISGDIESPGLLERIRGQVTGPTLFLLIGNAVIFSNRGVDALLHQAMQPEDYLLLTCESSHESMSDSYTIGPVYELLGVRGEEVTSSYNPATQCLEMCRGEEILLASYKPTLSQLQKRMQHSELQAVNIVHMEDIHMLAGLFTT